jgi:hypothetical protein
MDLNVIERPYDDDHRLGTFARMWGGVGEQCHGRGQQTGAEQAQQSPQDDQRQGVAARCQLRTAVVD